MSGQQPFKPFVKTFIAWCSSVFNIKATLVYFPHFDDGACFSCRWQKTRRPREILYAERKQLYYQPEGTSHDLRRWRARWQREGGQTQATVKRILCIRSVLQKKASSRFHEIFKSRMPRHGASVAPHVHGRALCIL